MTEGRDEPKVLVILDNALEVADKSNENRKRNYLRIGATCEYV